MNCPICNKEFQLTDAFCPNCGFEIHILPESASDAVKKHENERAKRFNETWYALQNSVVKEQKFEAQSKEIQQKLVEKQKELDDSIKDLSEKLSFADEDKRQLEAQLKEKQNELKDKTKELGNLLSEAQHKIEGLETQLKEKQEGASQFQKEIKDLQKQLSDDRFSIPKPLAFLVMSQEGNITAIYNILEGENSFGYAKSHEKHQQIICNTQISDVHFCIRAISAVDAKGRTRTKFFVAPRDGQLYGSSNCSNIINSERELDKNESVYIDDVRFTLVANKV